MPNNEMDYSLIHRTPDGNGKILVTTPGSPDKGSWETEAELKTYVNQDTVMKTDIVQNLGQQVDKVPSNKAVDDAINAINTRVTNIEETLIGENEITVQYPDDGNYSSLMPNRVPARALKFAEVPRFRGKTRAWNQLVPVPTSATETANNVTFTNNTDGTITITTNGTATANTAYICYIGSWRDGLSFVGGHKYLFSGSGLSSVRVEYIASPVGSGSNTVFYIDNFSDSSIATATGNGSWLYLEIRVSNGSTVNTTIIPQIYDLTAIFGAGNEPSTVADALAQIPALGQYNAYDAGSLVDTEVSGVESIGCNIFDNILEDGSFGSDGQEIVYSNWKRTENYLPIAPSTAYYYKDEGEAIYATLCFYDSAKNFISMLNGASGGIATSGSSFITPSTASYIRIAISVAYGSRGTIQVCLNSLSDKTTIHPYMTDTLSLPETVTLRSAGSVSDELDVESGVVERKVGSIDLGTLSWGKSSVFYTTISGIADYSEGICSKFLVYPMNSQAPSGIDYIQPRTNGSMYFRYVSGSPYENMTTEQFASAMSGVYLAYELATPTTESIDPVPDNFLEVEGGGTVETIQTQTPVIDNCLDVTYDIIPQ